MKDHGTGTNYRRGSIWWVKIHVDGQPVYQSSKSTSRQDAVKLRNKLLGKERRYNVVDDGDIALAKKLMSQ